MNEPESGLKHAPLRDKPRGRYARHALLRHWKQTRLAKSGGVGHKSFSSTPGQMIALELLEPTAVEGKTKSSYR